MNFVALKISLPAMAQALRKVPANLLIRFWIQRIACGLALCLPTACHSELAAMPQEIPHRGQGNGQDSTAIAASSAMKIGLCANVAPVANQTGEPQGIFVQLWQAWSKRTGQPVEFVIFDDHLAAESALLEGAIDLIGGIETQQVSDRMLFSKPIACFDRIAYYGNDVNRPDVIGLRDQQVSIDSRLRSDLPQLRPWLPTARVLESRSLAPTGTVLVQSEVFASQGHALGFDRNHNGFKTLYKRLVFFCVRDDRPELLDALELGWDQLNKSELLSIETTSLPAAARNRIFDIRNRLKLSRFELEFLKQHPIVYLGASPWEPLTIIDAEENYSGIALDLLAHHLQFLGVTPVYGGDPDWPKVVAGLDAGQFDGLGYAVPNEEREEEYAVSDPYVYAPLVVVCRGDQMFLDDPASLKGKRFGCDASFTAATLFQLKRPGTEIIEFPSRELAAMALRDGEIDGWLEIAPTARKVAAELGIDSFQIAFRTDIVDGMSLVLDPELEPLCAMFNRAIDCTSNERINEIYARYEPVFRENQTNSNAWLIGGLTLLLLGMSIVSFKLFGLVRASRQEIRQSEQKLRHAQRVSKSGSLEWEPSTNSVKMLGETYRLYPGSVSGQTDSMEYHLSRFDKYSAARLRQAWASLTKCRPLELELQLTCGNILRYELCAAAEEPAENCLVTVQDVSERVRRDAERARLNDKISQLKKLEALGNLAGGIAHDFNNILTASIVYNELALDSLNEEHPSHRLMSDVLTSSLRARDLVGQILTFSGERGVAEESVDLNQVAEESVALVRTSMPAHIELNCLQAADPVWVTANSIKLMQVMINLLSNAIQAMPTGGSIQLEVSATDRAVIRVKDQGQGIPQAFREKIYDPFFTTRPAGEGTGMGLAIVHNIVRSLAGEIHFDSDARGTTFVVELPLGQAKKLREPAHAEQPTMPNTRAGKTRIIVVDDEPAVLDVELRVLRLLGYEVFGFNSAKDALQSFREKPDQYDMLLTDMVMPGLSGMELLESIRSVRKDFPAVVCSGYDLENEFAMYPHLRQSVVQLNKPITSKSLATAINTSLSSPVI